MLCAGVIRGLALLGLLLGGLLVRVPPAGGQAESCFAETGHGVHGRFLTYRLADGGLAIKG